ncbi:MAG TPA: alpha/beta fold hydrolase [Parachlamydiaceae bacterium]|nr:alpha/beta fold hydrolase [Parachlamydiaceae bacterium]
MRLVALHGFLGKNSDWDVLSSLFIYPIDPFMFSRHGFLSLNEFGKQLNTHLEGKNILLGYSMGGRLGLHALLDDPKKWKAAIIISTHPGLDEDEKKTRIKSDSQLLREFEEDFDASLKKWNEMPLFSNQSTFLRKAQDHPPFHLKQSLKFWSLGNQQDLKPAIKNLDLPIFWIVGEHDEKFKHLAKTMQFSHPKSKIWIAENCFHRVAWEVPKACEKEIKQFLEGL